ncbi:MAG TPA: MATE family efflux transporter [Burkholderiaceae bacterium]|nr:MATE family efflux transporter [Burkholderiaceae bacterium]
MSAPVMPRVGLGPLARLAGPILVAQLAVMGLGVIDTVMAGRLSAHDLAAVAVGSSVYATFYVTFIGVLQALTPIAGHHFGAGRHADIGHDLGQALWLAAALAAIGVALLAWPAPWLQLARPEPRVAEITTTYLQAVAFGLPPALATRAYIALNSAVSRPQVTMAIQLAALASKVPLNLVFMYGAGPIPAFGGAGCGMATALIGWLTLLLSWLVWRLDPYFVRFRSGRHTGPRWARQRELLKLGLPSGGSLLIEVSSFTLIAILVARLGAATVAGHQIAANLIAVLFMVPLSIGVAASVLVAQSLGARAPHLAQRAARVGYGTAAALALIGTTTVFVLREQIVAAYTVDATVASVAFSLIGLACIFHIFDAMQGVAGFILRGYKVAFIPMLIHGAALWGIGLAGGYRLAFHPPAGWPYSGAQSFWIAAVVGLVVAAAGLSWLAHATARARLAELRE